MKADAKTSLQYKRGGITVLIRPTIKNGVERFVLDYRVNGERKLVWRSTLTEARQAASDAVDKIVDGQSEVLSLTNSDVHVYLRAKVEADALQIPLDAITRDHAAALNMLAGRASVIEACRDWLKRNDVTVPQKTVDDACAECLAMTRANQKSNVHVAHHSAVFDAFKKDHNIMVTEVTSGMIGQWLAGLKWSERTRRNYRDVLGHLNRWCVANGYLTKGTNWLEGVQKYSARKIGENEIFSPDELDALIGKADDRMLPFVVISAFAGLRHAEVARLDWSQIELLDDPEEVGKEKYFGWIEVKARNSKNKQRRLVPVQENLKAWLLPHRKQRGPVCDYANTTKQLLQIAADANVKWKHNALRHSFISYRVALTADVPRVADEAGNSPHMIREHYLRRVKPAEAARWFSITPADGKTNVVQMARAV